MTRSLWLTALLLAGCRATFVDQRELGPPADLAVDPRDFATAPPDFAGLDLFGVDLATPPDLTPPPVEGPIAEGAFEGRAGHAGTGMATLYRTAAGAIELRFDANFSVSGVVGPVVMLSTRDAIGNTIDPNQGDLELGALQKTSGAQSYPVPGGDGGRRVAWVYCKPFRVEVARAMLIAR